MIIYKAINKINNKVYIGQTYKTLKERIRNHKNQSLSGHKKAYFNLAIVKHGFENFIWEEIDSANSSEELDYLECYWIKWYHSNNRKYGYNLAIGGKVNRGYKQKNPSIFKGKLRPFGFKIKPGKPVRCIENDKIYKNIKEAASSLNLTPSGLTSVIRGKQKTFGGYHWEYLNESDKIKSKERCWTLSEESKNKISLSKMGKKYLHWNNPEFRNRHCIKVKCIEKDIIYDSVINASRSINIGSAHIVDVCRGNRKTCGGFHWEYV